MARKTAQQRASDTVIDSGVFQCAAQVVTACCTTLRCLNDAGIVFESQMQNIFSTNLSSFTFDVAETYVIVHGLNFIPALAQPTWADNYIA